MDDNSTKRTLLDHRGNERMMPSTRQTEDGKCAGRRATTPSGLFGAVIEPHDVGTHEDRTPLIVNQMQLLPAAQRSEVPSSGDRAAKSCQEAVRSRGNEPTGPGCVSQLFSS
jgi:hypothetical protein